MVGVRMNAICRNADQCASAAAGTRAVGFYFPPGRWNLISEIIILSIDIYFVENKLKCKKIKIKIKRALR